MDAKNFEIAQFIPQAQLVVGLQFVAVASPADTLKVFSTVWIPRPQSPDESCWHDVIHMSSYASQPKIQTARLHFAFPAQGGDSMSSPTLPVRGCTRPFPVHALPTYWFFLRSEACLTELTAAIAVCFATKTFSSEDLCLTVLAVRTSHGREPLLLLNNRTRKDTF